MFCSKGLTKETYLFGYAPCHLIQERRKSNSENISNGVLHYNRRDILDWLLTDESDDGYYDLNWLCDDAIEESSARLDILREVFHRANGRQLERLRDCDYYSGILDLCETAAKRGKLECLKFLRLNRCRWNQETWIWARDEGYEHILEYLRNNGFPTKWQVDSDSESESEDSDY